MGSRGSKPSPSSSPNPDGSTSSGNANGSSSSSSTSRRRLRLRTDSQNNPHNETSSDDVSDRNISHSNSHSNTANAGRRRRRGASNAGQDALNSGNCMNDEGIMDQAPKVGYWQMLRGGYDELVHAIIRPPRAEYSESVLGPTVFTVDGVVFEREDLELRNKRGQKLVCSHWKPRHMNSEDAQPMPCVIYLHGNASCRAEALETLPLILSSGMTLFALDFAGSGHSEGDYISLGWYEREDLEAAITYLRESGKTSTIGLWGRSMGAATALMFAERDPSIAAMVLDSPFASLKQLAKELSAEVNVPNVLMGVALRMVRSSVRARAHFDIFKLEPIKHAEASFIPALFGHGEDDHFILPHHSQQLFDAYGGDKNIILFDGDHSSTRPQFFNNSVGIFLYNTMISTTQQTSDVVGHADPQNFDFALNYTMPPPMAGSSAGSIDRSSTVGGLRTNTSGNGDYYEEAMIRHAIQLSLAEAQNASSSDVDHRGGAEHGHDINGSSAHNDHANENRRRGARGGPSDNDADDDDATDREEEDVHLHTADDDDDEFALEAALEASYEERVSGHPSSASPFGAGEEGSSSSSYENTTSSAYMDAPPLLQRLLAQSDELDVNNTEYSDARDGIRASELNHDDYKNPSSSAGRYLANYAEPPPAPNAAQPSRRGTDASMRARASSAGDDDNDDSRSNDSDDVQDEDSELEEVRAKSALDETSRLDDKQTHLHGEEFPTIDGVPLPLQDKDESLRRKASYSSSSSSGGNDGATRSKTNGRERPGKP
eukprot:CAMPEP_0171550556 /NCGR_PEP_ID=MMETSP0960-20121227/7137_1 /TAXON_ID=87120 /ORGANISM="Aurantiochytrium limacinum, Strain ATCCMYA-1381" /LENGTH=772 /DNA_ID=CAMNT_0012099519 /DNA_START=67 /DNA_END=2384 /DNA_ORIENTATION=-